MRKFISIIFLFCFLFLTFNCTGNSGDGEDDYSSTSTSTSTTIPIINNIEMSKDSSNDLLILTLNLHTYQEIKDNNKEKESYKNAGQNDKFNIITKLINDLDIDLIAFQECAQHKDEQILEDKIRIDNMAYIITKKLKEDYQKDYYYTWDWAHYGWDVWEEGIAVVSKYPITKSESIWISTSTGTTNLVSRKGIFGESEFPNIGKIHFFSTHTHWMASDTDTEHQKQITNIKNFVIQKEDETTDLSILCGDFNCKPTDVDPWIKSYNKIVENGDFVDTFLSANPTANNMPQQSIFDTIKGAYPGRIDYILMKKNDNFDVIDSKIIFTPTILGSVSDHYGVITKITKK